VAKFKGAFFDRARLAGKVEKGTAKAMRAFGALTRTIARRSMKKRNKPSAPGTPPRVIKGTLKKLIFFVYDRRQKDVVIGPVPFNGPVGVVPPILEYGGSVGGKKNPRRITRVLGNVGEIRLGGKRGKATKPARNMANERVLVTYAQLKTASQVRRANEINAELYGPKKMQAYEVESRPFMTPAGDEAKKQLPSLWAGAIS
jgi:hypothetical protein